MTRQSYAVSGMLAISGMTCASCAARVDHPATVRPDELVTT